MLENCFKKGMALMLAVLLTISLSPMQVFASESEIDTNVVVLEEKPQQADVVDSSPAVPTSAKKPASEETAKKPAEETEAVEEKAVPKEDAEESKETTLVEEKEETEAAKEQPAKPADARVSIINSADLNSKDPKSTDLDEYLHTVMNDFITDDMTTYEKTKASYDYIVSSMTYGNHASYQRLSVPLGGVTCGQIYSNYGAVEGFGAVALTSKVGMCNAYSSAFILMANEIGLDAYLVKGYTRGSGGSYVYHEWAEVNIDGGLYVFDPQLEQNLTSAGLGTYNVFGKTYSQTNGRYSKV